MGGSERPAACRSRLRANDPRTDDQCMGESSVSPLKPCLRPKRDLQYPISPRPGACQQIDTTKSPIGLFGAKQGCEGGFPSKLQHWRLPLLRCDPFSFSLAPLPKLALGAAFGFSRQLRKRIQASRLPAGSGQSRA